MYTSGSDRAKDAGWPSHQREAAVNRERTSQPTPFGTNIHAGAAGSVAPANKTVSQNASDYKEYSLFVVPNDRNCADCVKIALTMPEQVMLINVHTIRLQNRPQWLKQVPTLYCTLNKQAYIGTMCYNFLKQLSSSNNYFIGIGSQNLHIPASAKPRSALEHGGARGVSGIEQDNNGLSYYSPGGLSVGTFIPDISDMRRYEVSGKVTDDDVNKYMQQRERANRVQSLGPSINGSPSSLQHQTQF